MADSECWTRAVRVADVVPQVPGLVGEDSEGGREA